MAKKSCELKTLDMGGLTYERRDSYRDIMPLSYLESQTIEQTELDIFGSQEYPFSIFVLNGFSEGQEYSMVPQDKIKLLCDRFLAGFGSIRELSDYFYGHEDRFPDEKRDSIDSLFGEILEREIDGNEAEIRSLVENLSKLS